MKISCLVHALFFINQKTKLQVKVHIIRDDVTTLHMDNLTIVILNF